MINRRNNKKINLKTFIFFILIYLFINSFLNITFIKIFGSQNNVKDINEAISANQNNVKEINEIIPENKRTIQILNLYKDNKETILQEIQKIDPLLANLRQEYLDINNDQVIIMIPEHKKEELNICGRVVVGIQYIISKNIEDIISSKKINFKILYKDKDNKEKILKEIQKIDPLLENLRKEYLDIKNNQVIIMIPENKKEKLNIFGRSTINLNLQNDDSTKEVINDPKDKINQATSCSEKEVINNSKDKINQATSNKFNIWFWLIIFLIILLIILLFSYFFYYKNKKKI